MLVGSLAACAGSGGGRVLLLAMDGMDPRIVDLLLSEGKLPAFARMRRGGAHGRLRSARPLLSPVVWTTIATGVTPDRHRIGHFVAVNRVTGEQLPVTSQMRGVKALWNVASDSGRSVGVVGWWATWPAETVNGTIVSDHLGYHFLFEEGLESPEGEVTGRVFPPETEARIAPLVVRPADVTPEEAARYATVSAGDLARPFSFEDELGHFKWVLAATETHRRIGLDLWERDDPDLMMVYFEGVDSTSHLFGHLFRAEGLAGELAAQQERYGQAVEAMYARADAIIGEFLDAADERTTVVVVSDHGFELGALQDDPSRTRDMRRVSERYHSMEGILYLRGRGVKPYSRVEDASILDVAPTVLALLGIPPARDMPGRVLSGAFVDMPEPIRIATHETGSGEADGAARDTAVDGEILERLRSLGYLQMESPSGERNLAAVHFEAGRYEEAAEAYARLVEEDPEDGSLHASLAGALGALGRYDEAIEHLDRAIALEPLNPEAFHNRAVIHERRGDVEAAVEDYRTALRYNPGYEPSRAALERLGRPDSAAAPATPEQARAYAIAERAGGAARRGDYREAMRLLDEAMAIAPDYPLIYQYRSNVAYLMGDLDEAIAALEKGLDLQPDNALFKENLRRLRKAAP